VDWIHNGLGEADLGALTSKGLIPLSSHDPTKWDWVGNPGFRAKTVMDVNLYAGEVYILPLFKPHSDGSKTEYEAGTGNGSHYYYNIVEFVGIQITSDYKDNKRIMVQPAPYVDVNLVFQGGSQPPTVSSGTVTTTFTAPKLSR
jgi:hypothetical protein